MLGLRVLREAVTRTSAFEVFRHFRQANLFYPHFPIRVPAPSLVRDPIQLASNTKAIPRIAQAVLCTRSLRYTRGCPSVSWLVLASLRRAVAKHVFSLSVQFVPVPVKYFQIAEITVGPCPSCKYRCRMASMKAERECFDPAGRSIAESTSRESVRDVFTFISPT